MNINLNPTRENYYSQINNEILPLDSCNVTIMTEGLDVGKFGLKPINNISCSYRQPEDKLRHFIETNPTVQNYYKANFNTKVKAPEWAGVMIFAINLLYEKKIVYFDDNISLEKIIVDLQNGLPIYTSMKYPENKNNAGNLSPVDGHIVLIVGIKDNNNIIIDDPYKNHLTGSADGYNNIYTLEEFYKHNKGYAIRYKKND